ncbi:MAG: hypothetical protein D6744_17995 [Planctomycetota bacterium]|nr:MAG: hypothetical protein D6744_17995 [Planctomycetota bacterium]
MTNRAFVLIAVSLALLFPIDTRKSAAADCRLRPGVHGAGGCDSPLPAQLAHVQSVRFLLEDAAIHTIVTNQASADAFAAFLAGFTSNCIDVVITIRVVDPADAAFDAIPPASQQAAVLNDVRAFFATFAPTIDACQIGNEIFGGPGTYRINGRTAEQWTDGDFDALRAWLDAIAVAALDGAADASATLGLISPALTAGLTRRGALGVWQSACGPEPTCPPAGCGSPCYTPDPLATRLVDFIIAFGNETADMVDQHLHVHCREELAATITLLRQNPCGLLADAPRGLTSLE